MNSIDLWTLDLNLLVVLDVLLTERSVTRAAARLHRSQSAVSHALARLRQQLDDPLLVRVGSEMVPSERAKLMAPELNQLLRRTKAILEMTSDFDPATTQRRFTLVGPDFASAALPLLMNLMAADAPGATVAMMPPLQGIKRDLVDGRFDLALLHDTGGDVDGLAATPIATLTWTVFARADHPARDSWGPQAWQRYKHLRIATSNTSNGPVDRAAAAAGLSRRVGPVVPHFTMAPAMLAETDLLLTVPYGALARTAAAFGLIALPVPLNLPPIPLSLVWSKTRENDRATSWFRGHVKAAITDVLGETAPWAR